MRILAIVALCVGQILAAAGAGRAGGHSDAIDDRWTAGHNAVVYMGHCSGTLITDLIVLTAAHCVPPEVRAARPAEPGVHCAGLPHQHAIQGNAWEDPMVWTLLPRGKAMFIALGVAREDLRTPLRVRAYSIPRCADMALLQLVRRASPALVKPMQVLTDLPAGAAGPDAFLRQARLRYAGWGLGGLSPEDLPRRQTGGVSYWDRNACQLFTLPPERGNGERIRQGDSGSPLILRLDGQDLAAGVLFGRGLPDRDTCGLPLLPPPASHGAYTPTFRGAIAGTDATDLAAWIAHFAPEAVYRGAE